MDLHDAYHTLKESLGCINGSKEAHAHAVNNAEEYREVVAKNYAEVTASISMGQSILTLGELVRQFFNATHRCVGGKIVDLPGSEMCEELGKVAMETINSIRVVNQCTEEMAAVKMACDETSDMAYL